MSRSTFPLVIACCVIFLGGFITAWEEVGETGGPEGNHLQRFCQDRLDRCEASTTTAEECHHALLDLEFVEAGVVTWRIEWTLAVFVASLVAAAALASGSSTVISCYLFLITFLASVFGSRAKSSYQAAHVLKHPRHARITTLRKLLGAPRETSMAYY